MKLILPERLRSSGMPFRRLIEAIQRRACNFPHQIAWELGWDQADLNKARIRSYKNRHEGQRCVIMGNGPSLAKMDLSIIRDEIVFGLNRIYLLFREIPFRPSYLVAINELVLEQFAEDLEEIRITKFLNWNHRRYFKIGHEKNIFLKTSFGFEDRFQRELTKPISSGGTVTYVAMQLAYYMGFQEVVLVGVDHSFQTQGVPNTTEIRQESRDADHFHPEYFPKGAKWQLPDLQRSELAYSSARKAFEADGRRIIDATIKGKCPVFPKVDYREYFSGQ